MIRDYPNFFYVTYEEDFLAHSYKHINTRLIDGLVDLSKLIVLIKADGRSLLQLLLVCLNRCAWPKVIQLLHC